MNNAPQYSLRWNNYVSHVTEAFNALRFDNDLVDVTLCCDGGKIKAHKMLLSACSNYFKQIFKENPCQHPVIIFKNFKYEDLNAIINFMYHGEVNIFQEQLESFLNTAELLEVKGLTDNMEEEATQKLMRISDNTSLDLSAKSSRFSEDIVPVLSDEPINLATMQPVREEYIPQVSPVTFASEPENGAVEILPEVSKAEERASPMPTPATPPNEEMQVDMQSTSTEDFTEKSNSGGQNHQNLKEKIVSSTVSASQATKESCKNKPGRARNKRTFLRSKKNHRLQSNGGTKMPVKIKKVENVRQENTSVNKKPQSKAKRQLRTLKRKVLIESDLVKFRCQLCPKGFKHPTSLTLHKDSHAGKTQCPVCHRSFSRSYDMRSHLQRIHQGKQLTIKEIRYKNSDNSPKSFTHNI